MNFVGTIELLAQRRIGKIAAGLPAAKLVFRRLGVDYGCQGGLSLEEAAARRSLDIDILVDELSRLDATAAPPALPEETGALIDHICSRYHEVHRRQLPELIALSRRVEQVHAGIPAVPAGLADLLQRALGELEVHMRKEELILFPAMRRQPGTLDDPIFQMRHDHDDQGEVLERMAALTGNFTPPDGACGTWRALYAGAVRFRDDLIEHIHIENEILFPRFESAPA